MGKETIIVLAGGKSAEKHDLKNLKNYGYVIGVNDACIHVPVDCGISMDRTWFENRWKSIKSLKIPFYIRAEATINTKQAWSLLNVYECDRLSTWMTDEKGFLNGLNSGFCALNLAFQMKPQKIWALGFDCARTGYWYPPYEWQLAPQPRGITSDWAFDKWQHGLENIKTQFKDAGIEWI